MRIYLFLFIYIVGLSACINKKSEVDLLVSDYKPVVEQEIAYDGSLIYSDSAKLKVIVDYKVLRKFMEHNENYTEFPKGIYATFYDNNEKEISWLSAKYAIRDENKQTMTVRDSVVLHNVDEDKLVTSELIWEEKTELIKTDKYVRITQPMRGDTSYGYGLEAKQDFSEFQIGKFSGKGTIEGIGDR